MTKIGGSSHEGCTNGGYKCNDLHVTLIDREK